MWSSLDQHHLSAAQVRIRRTVRYSPALGVKAANGSDGLSPPSNLCALLVARRVSAESRGWSSTGPGSRRDRVKHSASFRHPRILNSTRFLAVIVLTSSTLDRVWMRIPVAMLDFCAVPCFGCILSVSYFLLFLITRFRACCKPRGTATTASSIARLPCIQMGVNGAARCGMQRVSRAASPAAAVQEHEAYAVLTSSPGSCGVMGALV
jgi:hypothetical protein